MVAGAGYSESTLRNNAPQTSGGQLFLSFLFSSMPDPLPGASHISSELSHLNQPKLDIPSRCAWRRVPLMILNPTNLKARFTMSRRFSVCLFIVFIFCFLTKEKLLLTVGPSEKPDEATLLLPVVRVLSPFLCFSASALSSHAQSVFICNICCGKAPASEHRAFRAVLKPLCLLWAPGAGETQEYTRFCFL